jgi:hypothetical protein
MNSIIYISLIYFFVGFFSDIVLNYLSRQTYAPDSVRALYVYFFRKLSYTRSPLLRDLVSAINAGLTIVAVLLLTMFASHYVFHFTHPRTLRELLKFMLLAFPLGYIADVFIYKTELFGPTLNPFYKIAGAGFSGAAAFLFSILVTYFIMDYIKK